MTEGGKNGSSCFPLLALGIAGLLLVVLVGPIVSSETKIGVSDTFPREGAVATYEMVADGIQWTIRIEIGGVAPCQDGFDRTFSCQTIDLKTTVQDGGFDFPIDFSLNHAEPVAAGNWDLSQGGVQQEHYAAPTPLWPGHPIALTGEERDPTTNSLRLFVTGLTSGIRAADGAEGDVQFAGHPADLTSEQNDKETILRLTASRGGGTFRYTMTYAQEDSLPSHLILERTHPTHMLIAEAHRTDSIPGDGPAMELDDWEPLDFPSVRGGHTPLPWRSAPPGGGFYLTLPEAWTLSRLSPLGIYYNTERPENYVVRATYIHGIGGPCDDIVWEEGKNICQNTPVVDDLNEGVLIRHGRWQLLQGDPDLEFRFSHVDAQGPVEVEQARTLRMNEDLFEDYEITYPELVPPRETLPSRLISVDDAYEIGRSAIPTHPARFSMTWQATERPELMGTADETVYILLCRTHNKFVPLWAFIDAASGQLLSRTSVFAPNCFGGDHGDYESPDNAPSRQIFMSQTPAREK